MSEAAVDTNDWEPGERAGGHNYRLYSRTKGSRRVVVKVSDTVASDPAFPLDTFLKREFAA